MRISAEFIDAMDPQFRAISMQHEGWVVGREDDKKHANPGKAVHITTTASIIIALCLPNRTWQ